VPSNSFVDENLALVVVKVKATAASCFPCLASCVHVITSSWLLASQPVSTSYVGPLVGVAEQTPSGTAKGAVFTSKSEWSEKVAGMELISSASIQTRC